MTPGAMPVAPGDYVIGAPASRLLLRAFRQGVAARAGHDLVIEARDWHGRVRVPAEVGAQVSIAVEVDLRTLFVVSGTGGVKPLSDHDRGEIHAAMQGPLRVGDHPVATYVSSEVRVAGEDASVDGTLALAGRTNALRLELHRDEGGTITGRGEVVQTRWGIKPYSGFFGALKLRDAVDLELSVTLAEAPGPPA